MLNIRWVKTENVYHKPGRATQAGNLKFIFLKYFLIVKSNILKLNKRELIFQRSSLYVAIF